MKTAKDLFKDERDKWLENARTTAFKLLKRSERITIEDVLKVCPRPQYVHPNTTGKVFIEKEFVAVGWRPSQRPLMNGRQVRVWTLRK